MELIRKNLHMSRTKTQNRVSITIDEDITIPDGKGPLNRKIKDMGEVCLDKIRPLDDKAEIYGTLYFGILYYSGNSCHSYYNKIVFDRNVSVPGISGQEIIRGYATLMDLKISIISNHRISVKAVVDVTLKAECEIARDVVYDVETGNVQCLRKEEKYLKLFSQKKDSFRIRESVNIDSELPNIDEIVWYDMHTEHMEIKPCDSGIGITGKLVINALYRETMDEHIHFFNGKCPFSGRLEIDEGEEDDIYDINIFSAEKSLICRNNENGESRILDGEILMSLDIMGYREEKVSLLEDIYSLNQTIIPKHEEMELDDILSNREYEGSVETEFTIPNMGEILYTAAEYYIDDISIEKDGVTVMGVISVDIFEEKDDDDKQIEVIRKELPFTEKIRADGVDDKSGITCRMENLYAEIKKTGVGTCKLNCSYELCLLIKKPVIINVISDVECKDDSQAGQKCVAGITGYIVKPGDTLWNIAKKYHTTVEKIMESNGLESDLIYPGMKLIILKLYCH